MNSINNAPDLGIGLRIKINPGVRFLIPDLNLLGYLIIDRVIEATRQDKPKAMSGEEFFKKVLADAISAMALPLVFDTDFEYFPSFVTINVAQNDLLSSLSPSTLYH
jgi:hypothetical protein